jgi:hypothetical protein
METINTVQNRPHVGRPTDYVIFSNFISDKTKSMIVYNRLEAFLTFLESFLEVSLSQPVIRVKQTSDLVIIRTSGGDRELKIVTIMSHLIIYQSLNGTVQRLHLE